MMEDGLEKNLDEVWKTAMAIVQATFVPRVTADKPCDEEDFRDYKCSAEKSFECLKNLLDKIIEKHKEPRASFKINSSFVTSLLILCAEHTSLQPWSTVATMNISHALLDALCQSHSCLKIGELLVGGKVNSDLFKSALLTLRPKLLKDSWKCYPSAVAAFKWLLFQVKFPDLNFENHSMVFTTSLIILDDFVSENKIIGIECLHHYTTNVTATDFRCYGRDIVVYDALFSHLYTREPEVLEYLLPCILTTLNKLKPVASTPDEDITPFVCQWGKFDDVLSNIFSAMMVDEHLKVRTVYLKFLPQFVSARGLRAVLFTKQMLLVSSAYMAASGPRSAQLTKTTLEVLLVFMKTIQVRLPAHAFDILQLLLRKLHDFSSQENRHEKDDSVAIVQLIIENLKFLIQSAPVQLGDFSVEYINSLELNETAKTTLIYACQSV